LAPIFVVSNITGNNQWGEIIFRWIFIFYWVDYEIGDN